MYGLLEPVSYVVVAATVSMSIVFYTTSAAAIVKLDNFLMRADKKTVEKREERHYNNGTLLSQQQTLLANIPVIKPSCERCAARTIIYVSGCCTTRACCNHVPNRKLPIYIHKHTHTLARRDLNRGIIIT